MMDKIYWNQSQVTEPQAAVESLSAAERDTYDGFRFDQRRRTWLAGRYAAKSLLSNAMDGDLGPDQIVIANNDLGAPLAIVSGKRVPGCLSISHTGEWGAAAFASSGIQVGIDIERITMRSGAFVRDYFTAHEVELVSAANGNAAETITLIWSAKEALLKAMGVGLRLDTRQVEVLSISESGQVDQTGWHWMGLVSPKLQAQVDAFWRMFKGQLMTLVALKDAGKNLTLVEIT